MFSVSMDLAIYTDMKTPELDREQLTILKSMVEQEIKAIGTEWSKARKEENASYIIQIEQLHWVLLNALEG